MEKGFLEAVKVGAREGFFFFLRDLPYVLLFSLFFLFLALWFK